MANQSDIEPRNSGEFQPIVKDPARPGIHDHDLISVPLCCGEGERDVCKACEELENRIAERSADLHLALRQLQEKEHLLVLQNRMAAVGEAVGNIAHQWRQPLDTLQLLLRTLALRYQRCEVTREVADETLTQCLRLVRHMSETIDHFRDFLRKEKHEEEFKVGEVTSAAVTLVESTFKNAGISIMVSCAEDSLVLGFPGEFTQVILNLLNNAKDAFEIRRTEDPQVVVTVSARDGHAIVTVRDNAGGIANDIITQVFDPFFTTKDSHGSGIGLFMCKTIIESHMTGKITARNLYDGAELCIDLKRRNGIP